MPKKKEDLSQKYYDLMGRLDEIIYTAYSVSNDPAVEQIFDETEKAMSGNTDALESISKILLSSRSAYKELESWDEHVGKGNLYGILAELQEESGVDFHLDVLESYVPGQKAAYEKRAGIRKEKPKQEIKEEPKQEIKEEPKPEIKEEPKPEIKEGPKQEIKEEPKQEIKEEPKQEDPAAAFARAKAAFREQAIDLYARQAHEFKIEQHIKAHTEYTPEEIQSVRDGNRYESIRDSEENKAFKAQIADSPLFGDFLASITDMGKLDAAKDLAADNNGKALYDFINQEKFRAAAAAPEVREAPKQEDAPKNNADDQKIQKIVSAKKNTSEKRWRPLVRMFGKNGHMVAGNSVYKPECIQEYDSIELPIPDGLTEDMVALIAMGVAMDRSKLNKKMTDSTPAHGVSLVEWNAGFIAMNLLTGDSRSIGFSEHLVESRKIAKQILEDYQNNKPEGIKAVQKAIQNVVPTALADFTHMDLHSLGQVEHELPVILEKMSKVPKLGLSTPKDIQPKLTSHRVRVEASDQAIAAFEELAKTKPAANTPERERLVAEFLFEHAVAVEGTNSRPDVRKMIKEKHENQVLEEYREYANIPKPKKELWDKRGAVIESALNKKIDMIDDDLSINAYHSHINMQLLTNAGYAYQKAHLTPGELTLTEPGGKEKLRAFYMEDIKRSDIFKAMVSEPDMLKLTKQMNEHITNSDISFATYSNKIIPVQDPSQLTIKGSAQEYQDALQAYRHGYDVLFSPKIILDACEDAMDGLDANWAVHKDSKELKALKASVKKLQGSYDEEKPFAKEITEEQKEALMDALKASITYQDAKRREAKASTDPMDDFEPGSTAGKERMRGAKVIEDLAARMLFNNDKNKMLSFKINYVREIEMQKAKISSDSDIGKALKDSMRAVSAQAGKLKPKDSATGLAEGLAKVIALNTLGKASPNGTEMSEDDLTLRVSALTQEIKERKDFQRMVGSLTVKKAAKLATETNGDPLLAELAKHKKQLLAEEKRPKTEPNRNANRVKENDQRKIGS